MLQNTPQVVKNLIILNVLMYLGSGLIGDSVAVPLLAASLLISIAAAASTGLWNSMKANPFVTPSAPLGMWRPFSRTTPI